MLLDLGLGYLALDRGTPTLSPGELQRLRLATQVRSNLFGVVYVLDEPSAGLHPSDTEALLRALDRLKASGNSLFVVEHDLDVIRHADWIVDVGPAAGQHGGEILYSGPPAGLAGVEASQTRRYLFREHAAPARTPRDAPGLAPPGGGEPQQPPRARRRLPARGVHERHGHLGLGEVEPGEPGPGRAGRRVPGARDRVGGRGRRPAGAAGLGHHRREDRRRSGGTSPTRARRPEADRSDAAVEPRHLHGAVRPHSPALRRDQIGAGPSLRRRAVLVQRRQGPVRELPGRGLRHGRAALPAERLRPLPGLPRRTLQRQDARDQVSGEEHRRRPRDDRRRGCASSSPTSRRSCARWTSCTTSAWGISGSASRPPSCRAARRSGSSSRPSCSGPSGATPSTSSTSRRPACTRPTSRS